MIDSLLSCLLAYFNHIKQYSLRFIVSIFSLLKANEMQPIKILLN